MSRRSLLSFVGLLVMATSVSVSTRAETLLRSSVDPKTAWVGQRVLLKVDVMSDAGWAQVSRFGEVELVGAYVLRTDAQGVRLQENIEGKSFSGQRYELSIYPQAAGALRVPAIPVEVSVRSYGAGSGVKSGAVGEQGEHATTPVATIEVRTPPGAEGIDGLISTSSLTVDQRWESVPDEPKLGDALKRVIEFEASEVSGMAFIPLEFDVSPGVGVYPSEPRVQDKIDRGSLIGTRSESVSYVLEKPGAVSLPDISFSWWNMDSERLEQLTLPGRELKVAAGADDPRSGAEDNRAAVIPPGPAVALILAALIAGTLYRFRDTLLMRWHLWRVERQQSEASVFKRAVASIESGDSRCAIADLMRWLDRIHRGKRPARLGEFLEQFANADEQQRLSVLLNAANGEMRLAEPKRLASDLVKLRARWRAARSGTTKGATWLPSLN